MKPLRLLLAVLGMAILFPGCLDAWNRDDPADDLSGSFSIPRMSTPPALDRTLTDGEWEQARLIEGVFSIQDGTEATGDYPFQLWIGADERNLYLLAVITAGPNPWTRVVYNGSFWDAGSVWHDDRLDLFFTDGASGALTVPSDWKGFSNRREQGSGTDDGYWSGRLWTSQPEGPGEGTFNDGRPTGGTWGRGGYTNETIFWEIYIPRESPNVGHDGLRAAKGEVFRMGAMFSRQGMEGRTSWYEFPRDTFPGDGPTPDGYLQPDTWLRLRVDF